MGDRVMTFRGQGIWTDYDIIDQSALIRIKENIDLVCNYALEKDFDNS